MLLNYVLYYCTLVKYLSLIVPILYCPSTFLDFKDYAVFVCGCSLG